MNNLLFPANFTHPVEPKAQSLAKRPKIPSMIFDILRTLSVVRNRTVADFERFLDSTRE